MFPNASGYTQQLVRLNSFMSINLHVMEAAGIKCVYAFV